MNEQNLKPKTSLSSEEAKKMGRKGGKKSVEARRERKALREILLSQLDKETAPGSGMTKLEYLVAKCLANHSKDKMSFKDLKDLQDLMGESVTNVKVSGDALNVITTEDIATKMEKL